MTGTGTRTGAAVLSYEKSPTPIAPYYSTPEVNSPVVLYSGRMAFSQGGDRYEGTGMVELQWLPSPRLRSRLQTQKQVERDLKLHFELLSNQQPVDVELLDLRRTISTVLVGAGHISGSLVEIVGIVDEEIVVGVDDGLSALVFHLPNIPGWHLSPDCFVLEDQNSSRRWERLILRVDSWIVTLDPVENESVLQNAAAAIRGWAFTRVGRLVRADGNPFSVEDARDAIGVLESLLSFAHERWCGAFLWVGVGSDGQPKCRVWSARRAGPFQPHQGWFDFHHPGSLSALSQALCLRSHDKEMWSALRDAMYWLIEIQREPLHLETCVVVGQVTLEMLSWLLLVEQSTMVSEGGFDKLPAADKLRLLLSSCGIPVDVPVDLQALQPIAAAENWQGPDAIVSVRNLIVHRNRKKRERWSEKGIDGGVLHDAYKLTCWYIELVILHQLGYEGPYSCRLKRRFVGHTEPVPWVPVSGVTQADAQHVAKPCR